MLDPTRRVTLPACPEALVFRDHAVAGRCYLLPATPSVELEQAGLPAARALVFLQRHGDSRTPSGGRLTLTTVLRASGAWREQVRAALAALPDAGPVDLASPDWAGGRVTVGIGESIRLQGSPSLGADNRCALAATLDAAQAALLREHWAKRLPGASIVYELELLTASGAERGLSLHDSAHEADGATRVDRERRLQVQLQAGAAGRATLRVQGPLWAEGLERRLSEIEL